jgi:hypothetical protein
MKMAMVNPSCETTTRDHAQRRADQYGRPQTVRRTAYGHWYYVDATAIMPDDPSQYVGQYSVIPASWIDALEANRHAMLTERMTYEQAKSAAFGFGSVPDGYFGARMPCVFSLHPDGSVLAVHAHGYHRAISQPATDEREAAWLLANYAGKAAGVELVHASV